MAVMIIDKLDQFLTQVEPALLVIIPTLYGIYLKIRSRVNELNDANTEKNQLQYDAWRHEQSRMTIFKIKEQCNVYKDRSGAEHVFFLQLENGTVATAKIFNMYLTCLAEDNRYSDSPKIQLNLQRIPYSQLAEWCAESQKKIYVTDMQEHQTNWPQAIVPNDIKTIISTGVRDKDGFVIGFAVFMSRDSSAGNITQTKPIELMKEFKTAIETIFLSFNVECKDKQAELGLKEAV